jgi:crossover junction endodeoxyribonuclease RuvC
VTLLVIGIDAGLTGAVAHLQPSAAHVEDLPTMAAGDKLGSIKTQVNPAALALQLRQITAGHDRGDVLVVTEGLTGYVDHKAAIFSMGNSFGCIRGVVATLGLPLEIVRPQDWKKHFGLPRDKEHARRKAIELYPEAPLSRVKDHNRAEALLIARYGWDALR